MARLFLVGVGHQIVNILIWKKLMAYYIPYFMGVRVEYH